MLIKMLANESFCNTTPNVYSYTFPVVNNANQTSYTMTGATLLRLYNSNTTNAFLITKAVNSSVNISSITIGPNMEMLVEKSATDLLSTNNAGNFVFACPVAYKST